LISQSARAINTQPPAEGSAEGEDRPRILFLTESFHPALGGGETHIRELSRHLVASAMPATVLTRQGEAVWKREDVLEGVRILRVPPSGPGRSGKYGMVPAAMVRVLRESNSFDVLVVRGTRVLGLPALVAGRLLGKPVVLQAEVNGEMSGEVYTWGTPLARWPWRLPVIAAVRLRNVFLRDADAFVAMSRRIRDEFLEMGVPADRVWHLPHGVDTERFRPASDQEKTALRRALGLPADALLVTYTGRLLRGKGLEVLLSAFAKVAASEPAARLVLVGSGAGQALSAEEELEALAHRLDVAPLVVFAGRVENVPDYLRASDVFAFPSVFEALGLSLIEAAACGLPCVGARTGGIVDVIEEGRSGALVAPGDVNALGLALLALLSDAGRRRALGERAREIACARFDLRDNVLAYRSLFRELWKRRSAP
jgi:glycosyltransferase involved in cell wall biosynthesis